MVNDPERLAQLASDAARTERAWREPPPEGFGSVLERSPARGEMEDAVVADRRRRAPDDGVAETADAATTTPTAKAKASPTAPQRLSPRAPDPREKMLRAQLATRSNSPVTTSKPHAAGETPPTGSVATFPRGSR